MYFPIAAIDTPVFLITTRLLPTNASEGDTVPDVAAGQIATWTAHSSSYYPASTGTSQRLLDIVHYGLGHAIHDESTYCSISNNPLPHSCTSNLIINHTRSFALHLLHTDQSALIPIFGLQTSRTANKFASMTHCGRPDSKHNLPPKSDASMVFDSPNIGSPLIGGVVGWNECVVVNVTENETNWLVTAECICGGKGLGEKGDESPLYLSKARQVLDPTVVQELDRVYRRDTERDTVIRRLGRS
ncbi:hypothetical protein HK097_003872 [Rhizophlyctis rosea]|uniref:Flavin reductase like domain-containing protein n=1 Tax=Rhizophlyctis rosea TaxID=64517 RepID=A0AAD5SMB3_9FUNG|nr:hypothetical protein HK097_003872 [Rhizophlyctis rosea]